MLFGSWRFAGQGLEHSYYFGVGGELIHSSRRSPDAAPDLAMLTWRIEGEALLIDQPSAPRIDRLPFQLASEATLRIGDAWYVRETELLNPDAPRLALIAAAAWYGAENVHASGEPFVPFLMIERGTSRALVRLVASTAQEAEQAAHDRLERETFTRAAWARDGRVRMPEPHDAVLVDGVEPGRPPLNYAALYALESATARVTGFMQLDARAPAFR